MNSPDKDNPDNQNQDNSSPNLQPNNARTSVQLQMEEYRKRMSRRASEPAQKTEPQLETSAPKSNNNPFRDEEPKENRCYSVVSDEQERLLNDKPSTAPPGSLSAFVNQKRDGTYQQEYVPPDLAFSPQSTSSPKALNQTNYRNSSTTDHSTMIRTSLVDV